jgi:hypothetical protein
MGMFDYLIVSIDKLPLTTEEKEKWGDKFHFQTKELDCTLTNVHITDDGELKVSRFTDKHLDYLRSIGEAFANYGIPNKEHERLDKINYHGILEFHDLVEDVWFEFGAKFTDGNLVEIIKINQETIKRSTP